MYSFINGIQQIGLGVADAKAVFNWYRKHLGFDILVFKDESPATLMTRYTGGKIENRLALLAMNMKGGGGLEIWQFRDRAPQKPEIELQWGDFGINAMKVRSTSIEITHSYLKNLQLPLITNLIQSGESVSHFYFKDPWNNLVEVVSDPYSFCATKSNCGGVLGAIIGVSDMEASIRFYQELLQYDIIASDQTGLFDDFETLAGGHYTFRRVCLRHSARKVGGFGELLGPTEIDLIQVVDRKAINIYENRYWGDLGYIHLCFDIQNMTAFQKIATALKYPFTVDSADSFDMGKAAGRFSYVEDPDGMLIEFVETHKVPILKRFGLSINLKKRNPKRPLPKWLVKAMQIRRVRKNL